jgi:hypothetical protein
MNSSHDSPIVMLGLSGTGKTNFIVALDVMLDDQTDPDGLRHSGFAADRVYLQPLKEQWLRGGEFEKTSRLQQPPPHQLLVVHPATGTTACFYLPDLAGETFDAHFETRSFPLEFCDRLKRAAGLLVFVHCEHNADHTILEDPSFMEPESTTTASPAAEPASAWQIENAARQTKLVDLLQFIAETRLRQSPVHIAVLISAWDLVEKAPQLGPRAAAELPKDPSRFFSIQWPLLDQFLRSHEGLFRLRVFGVSARGGGKTPEEIARLTTFDRPSDRILIVEGEHRSNDLTRPVRWLLGLLKDATPTDG